MTLSRRHFLSTAAAAGVAATAWPLGGAEAASAVGDVVGKITVGYQGWFACKGDGAPIQGWWHWAQDWGRTPSPSNRAIISWPDMRDYAAGYPTAFANLGNGAPATLFSSYDQSTVDTHFRWMQQNGCDTAALQRFNPNGGEGATRDAMALKVRSAAESYGRKFYVMYDVSGWQGMQSEIKADWLNKMSALVASSAYARQNGRPVVGLWGFGFNDDNHPWSAAACLDVIQWFKSQGCYVMGGVPTYWREGKNDSRAGYLEVYHAFNMISPWMVGRIGDAAGSDWFYANVNLADQADCNAHGIDYQPCVLPGDLSARQRAHGDFMWRQFYNMVRLGAQGLYISMFDEFNEGNQIAKTAESAAFVPVGSGILALDEDGTACSADYYLRLTADGGRMLKGQIALTANRPTAPVLSGSGAAQIVTLKARVNGRYVTAENAGAEPLVANRTAVGGWEQFELVDAGSGLVALRARVNGRLVCAESAGASPLIANRTAIGPWESFRLIRNANGSVSLLSLANNRYVTAESAGAAALVANRTAIGLWEQFDLATAKAR
ncbi:lectin [Roseateles amylovorans]|uniref:Lectin n=1 Tax=Roseateles amylovorans TaxID=2978473 RepID=A0ABY6AXK4_9BURK|nr:lectin [Roseateles amylovorans]UXH77139.1 lectin [Roseateles amylovorans]